MIKMNEELDYSKLNGTKCYNAQGEDGKDAFEHICEQINKLQNNWNELKKWCKENQYNDNFDSYQVDNYTTYGVILKKMQELEQGKWNNEAL